jgi:DNA-binding transcriptional MerR regulator
LTLTIPDEVLADLEARKREGLTSSEILKLFEDHGLKFSEATLRKYVQLGLLPRSVRVGRKGKHTGSQGIYPASIVKQILAIKQMMAENLTIEEIKREVWFVRGDIEELERKLEKIFATVRGSLKKQRSEPTAKAVGTEIGAAEALAKELVGRLVKLEERLTTQSRLARREEERSATG